MNTFLISAITKGWPPILLVAALLSWGGIAEPAPPLDPQLLEAAEQGDLALVSALLKKGADVHEKTPFGGTALERAARSGHLNVVSL